MMLEEDTMQRWVWGLLGLCLGGCVTIQDSKSLVIHPQPGETAIAVTSTARAHCQDYFFIVRCELTMDLKQVK
jgi:hypothetical protein